MGIITDYVDGPYEGVSQTPPQVRLAGACEAMEDCLPAIPNGLQKRPPLTWIKALTSNGLASAEVTILDVPREDAAHDATLILSREGGSTVARLFLTSDMSPISVTVSPAAQAYLDLNSPNPNSDLRAVSVEDVTFITNRTVTAAVSGSTSATRPFEAMIWVKASQYARTYVVTVSPAGGTPVAASYGTDSGSSALGAFGLNTDGIARCLFDGTDPDPGHGAPAGVPLDTLTSQGFTVSISGSVIYLSHPTVDFSIDAQDGQGHTAMVAVKEAVQRFSDLPAAGVDGFTVKIAAESAGGLSDYYVQFAATNTSTSGVWTEVIKPGAPLGLDPTTMPVGLKDAAGVWTLDSLPWKHRLVGDEVLSPDPPFIGDQITDIKWWRGRLELISTGSAMLSSSDDPFKFYASTLTVAEDSDAIDFLPPAERKTSFKAALTFDSRNLIFADKAQAVISSTGAVSATGARIDLLGTSDFSDQIIPQGSNHKVYYAAMRTKTAAIYELSIDRLSGLALVDDKTKAIPTYIPNTINVAATEQIDYMTIYGTAGSGQLYIHIYRYSDFQQVQNSWSRWNLHGDWKLGGFYFKATTLYVLAFDPGGLNYHWFTLDVAPGRIDDGAGATVLTTLDMRFKDTDCGAIVYDATANTTTYTVAQTNYIEQMTVSVRAPIPAAEGSYGEGFLPPVVSQVGTTIVLAGDWRAYSLWFGYKYDSTVTQSKWYKRGQDQRPEHGGRLSLKKMRLDLSDFGHLTVTVSIAGRADRVTEFEGYFLNDPDTMTDIPPHKKTVALAVPIGGNAEETTIVLNNDSHLGFKLLGIEWQADWNPFARRVS